MKFAFTNAKRNTGTNAATVSFFFNARGDTLEKTTEGMLRSVLLQVLEKFEDLQDLLDDTACLPEHHIDSSMWTIQLLQETFSSVVSRINKRRVTCFIDALDECDEDEVRNMVEFFESLGDWATQIGNKLYICLSSRHYPYIDIRYGKKLVLEHQPDHGKDLETYVHGRLRTGDGPWIQDIRSRVVSKADGVFMWAVLVVDILNKEFRRGRHFAVEARLEQTPSQLSELFKDMLKRDTDNMAELLLCIQWTLYAKKPLKREEFYFAVVSGISPTSLAEWNPEHINLDDMERFVLSSSKGLAEVTRSKTKTVQFIHESVRDFLIKDNGLRDLWQELGEDFESASHDRLKRCCLTYIGIGESAYLPGSSHSTSLTLPKASSDEAKELRDFVSKKFPFLKYATHHVFHHANEAAAKLQQITFLEHFPLRSWIGLDNLFEKHQIRRHTPTVTLLYLFAEKDWTRLITAQMSRDPQIDFLGERYHYPLFAAIANGHHNAVHAILHHNTGSSAIDDIPVEIPYGKYLVVRTKHYTPLLWAAENKYEGLVKLLLNTGKVDVNARGRDVWEETPLLVAAGLGYEGIVKLLLDTNRVDVNARSRRGWKDTALIRAAREGYEGIVKLLLETNGVDVGARNRKGFTPLIQAVMQGHERVVKLLLETGKADIEARDKFGSNVLWWAENTDPRNRRESIKLMLRRCLE